ncbi:MAG: hypothetical protein M3Q58_09160 [Bacteroidota bacterium]|nr:hypothetical protein [Bacteroidota bacterium]
MCKFCFQEIIRGFYSELEFKKVEIEIEKREKDGILTYIGDFGGEIKPFIKIAGIGIGGETIPGYRLYLCNKCGIKWKLSIPENAWRGFLIKEDK